MNIWLLSEERPKIEVIVMILNEYTKIKNTSTRVDQENLKIEPVFCYGVFIFTYKVLGIFLDGVDEILLKIVSGKSSFVDYLVYEGNEHLPNSENAPVIAVEETKTSDKESRNTGISQRISKFVYLDFYYHNVKKIMLYNLKIEEQENLSNTNKFGTRILKTLGVKIEGKIESDLCAFSNIDELISYRNNFRKPPTGNVPIRIKRMNANAISISGRLIKNNSLSHDPNIGILSGISKALRVLGFKGDIIVTHHGLKQQHIKNNKNKFLLMANSLKIQLDGIVYPSLLPNKNYWNFDKTSEKNASILLHLLCENIDNLVCIYENHAGCERGYLITPNQVPVVVPKYPNQDKSSKQIISLPDLVILDNDASEINILEGKITKKLKEAQADIKKMKNFIAFLKQFYSTQCIKKGIVLFGGYSDAENVFFVLSEEGEINVFDNRSNFLKQVKEYIARLNTKYTLDKKL